MMIVNTATTLRGLVDQENADRLFNLLEPRYRALPVGEPGRTALWEALHHLNPASAHRLSAGADLAAGPAGDTTEARPEIVS
jgi:hypothetical protein